MSSEQTLPSKVLFIGIWGLSLIISFFIGKIFQEKAHASATLQASKSTSAVTTKATSTSTPSTKTTSTRSRLESSPLVRPGASNAEIIQDVLRHEDPIARNNALLALIETLSPKDFKSVVDAFRELGITDSRRSEYAMLLTAWAQVNPQEAIDYAKNNTRGTFARNTILATWAGTDPDAAITWAEGNHDSPDEANPWLVGVIRGLAPNDPERATALMESMPRSRERGSALGAMVDLLIARDPDEAKEWAFSIGDEALRSGAFAFTANSIASNNPAEAANWLSKINDTEALNRVSDNLTSSWYDEDPEAAKAWVSTLPTEAMSNAAAGIVEQLISNDPVQAAEYLSELSTQNPDTNFDSSIRKLVRGSRQKDPELAAVWIAGFSEPETQTRYYHRTLRMWKESDDAAASQWIQENFQTLPGSVQSRFSSSNNNQN